MWVEPEAKFACMSMYKIPEQMFGGTPGVPEHKFVQTYLDREHKLDLPSGCEPDRLEEPSRDIVL